MGWERNKGEEERGGGVMGGRGGVGVLKGREHNMLYFAKSEKFLIKNFIKSCKNCFTNE